MRQVFSIVVVVAIVLMVFPCKAQEISDKTIQPIPIEVRREMMKRDYPLPDEAYWLSPTCDPNSATEIYIPKDIEDAFKELDRMLTREFRDYFAKCPISDTLKYHFGLGMWLRNNWGMWSGDRLASYFASIGIFHPDDMSGIILDSYWRYLNRTDICLQEQVEVYQEYWRMQQQ
jgi:hypothetical protein